MKKGWERKNVGEVCDVVNGGTPKTGVAEYWNGLHLWITPAEMGKRLSPYVGDTERKVSDLGLQASSARMLPAHSVILSSRAPIGHLVINSRPMSTNQGCKGLVPGKQLNHKFLYYYLTSIVELLDALGTGATFRELSSGKLKEVPVPIPPLAEQQRIVGVLDEVLAGLATAKANAETNLRNARALFESDLQAVFTQEGEGWVAMTLSEATGGIFTGPFGSLLHKRDYVHDGIPLVNPAHITETGIDPDVRKSVSKETAQRLSGYILRKGDIVIGRRGEMGRCALVTEAEDGWLCGTGSFFIRPSSRSDSSYLVRLLRSESYRQRLEKIAGGAVMPNLSNTDLGNLRLRLPSVGQQKAIVREIEALHFETQRLENLYRRKLGALGTLKKSLLHQAFSGAL